MGCHIFILFLGTHISKSVNKCDTHKFIIFSQSEVKSVLKDEEQEGMERFLAMKKIVTASTFILNFNHVIKLHQIFLECAVYL